MAVSEEKAQEAYDKLMNRYKGTGIEITLVNGGQPVYYFTISVE